MTYYIISELLKWQMFSITDHTLQNTNHKTHLQNIYHTVGSSVNSKVKIYKSCKTYI